MPPSLSNYLDYVSLRQALLNSLVIQHREKHKINNTNTQGKKQKPKIMQSLFSFKQVMMYKLINFYEVISTCDEGEYKMLVLFDRGAFVSKHEQRSMDWFALLKCSH